MQKDYVRRVLQSGEPITPAKALADARIFRLAAIIYKLKKEGMNIVTFRRRSPAGHQYAEYRLASKTM